jgi:hypothetical protein
MRLHLHDKPSCGWIGAAGLVPGLKGGMLTPSRPQAFTCVFTFMGCPPVVASWCWSRPGLVTTADPGIARITGLHVGFHFHGGSSWAGGGAAAPYSMGGRSGFVPAPPALMRLFTFMGCPPQCVGGGDGPLVRTEVGLGVPAPGLHVRLHLHGVPSCVRVDNTEHIAVLREGGAKSTPRDPAVTHHTDDPGGGDKL